MEIHFLCKFNKAWEQFIMDPGRARQAKKQEETQQKERARMLKTIGQLTLERDFLQDCFRRTGGAVPEFDPEKF